MKKNTVIRSAAKCMPCSKKSREILRARAELVAKSLVETSDQAEKENYICFYLGEKEKYGIDYKYTKEVIANNNITPVPCAPAFVAGVINRRGALLAIIDLRKLLYNETDTLTEDTNIIIVSANDITLGILANYIEGNKRYDPTTLDMPILSENIVKTDYIVGLHQAQTALINIEAITTDLQSQLSKSTTAV